MFFHIGKTVQENFPYNHQTDNFVINLDEGWTQVQDSQGNNIWFKGYLDDAPLHQYALRISEENKPTYSGNFCVIKVTSQGAIIKSDRLRSFPIWYNGQELTNLKNIGETIWADCLVTLNNNLTLTRSYFDAVGEIPDVKLSFNKIVDQVDTILKNKVINFLKYKELPIKVFLSGGIDTALVFSYLKKYSNDYELILNSHIDYDYFYLKNHGHLSKLWGYTQIHHWNNQCYLASGAPGDEFTVRSPVTANFLLLAHKTSIPKLLADPEYANCLHYYYFNQQKYLDAWAKQEQEYNEKENSWVDTLQLCCNYNLNDWQHWHLGQTLTWTPMRDLEIFKLIANLPIEYLKQQVMNSIIQIELIKRNNPEILTYLSTQKNTLNYMENLTKLL
jgi:hypothetical protein